MEGQGARLPADPRYPISRHGGRIARRRLLVTLDGKQATYALQAADTVWIPLPGEEDSLVITNQKNSSPESRLRYLTLVSSAQGNEAPETVQVEIRENSDSDVIAFTAKPQGDSLIAAGENNPQRWGENFAINTVSAGSNRTLVVSHAGITRVLQKGESPNTAFKGTPVSGAWSISSPMTTEEKSGTQRPPPFLKITITIIHR
jgi:hypothetical protein